jgi:hypothetical protein
MFFLFLMCQCAEAKERVWGNLHAIPDILTSSGKHSAHTN